MFFRKGGSVLAAKSHRWPMDEFTGPGRRPRAVSTQDIVEIGVTYERPLTSGRTKATKPGVARWRTHQSPVLEGRHHPCPIPPYVLGYWLGDGDATRAAISCGDDDLANLLPHLTAMGVQPRVYKTHGSANNVFFTGERNGERFGRGSAALRGAGVLNDKHIPADFLTAPARQRWDLLAGLVDSDGSVAPSGIVEIGLSRKTLADDVFALTVSLGLMPSFTTKKITRCRGKDYGPHYRIRFTPRPGDPVSKLPRKRALLKKTEKHHPQSRSRTVVAVGGAVDLPVSRITIEHVSGSYLVGDRNIPTLAHQHCRG